MAKTNVKQKATVFTHEGGPSIEMGAIKLLRRSLMANMLFEDEFYEDGVTIANRIATLIPKVSFADAAQAAIDAREKFKLRHAPLLVVREMLRIHKGRQMGDLIARVIQRPDECGELLALYWKEKQGAPLTSQLKVGLARALKKFNEYELAKWNRDGAVKLRDVLFLSHARPRDEAQKLLFEKLAKNELATPDTWEVALSGGADKGETFTRLLSENKLGALALLRNLRNMTEAKVDDALIRKAIVSMKTERVLPFRFISAARYAPRFEPELEQAMFRCVQEIEPLKGNTAILVDNSGSMSAPISGKSELSRADAAAALAVILRERASTCRVFSFSDKGYEVAPRRGFALIEAIRNSCRMGGTDLRAGVKKVYEAFPECDRLIVVTDEQSMSRPEHPQGRGYVINIASNRNGIAYGPWLSIDGWSEACLDYIVAHEADNAES